MRPSDYPLHTAIVQSMSDGVCVVRASDLTIVYANPGFETMFGCEPDEPLGRPISTFLLDLSDAHLAELRRGAARYEVRGRKKDGSSCWCRGRASTFIHPQHGLVWAGIHADVTHEHEAAERLHARDGDREWLSTLFEVAPIGLLGFDTSGKVIHNRRAADLLGAELTGPHVEAYVHTIRRADGTPVPRDRTPIDRVLRGEHVAGEEYMIVRPDGTRRWLSGAATPVRGGDGRQLGAIAAFEDITPRRRQEEELRLLAEAGKALAESLDYEDTLRRVAHLAVPRLADGCVMYLLDLGGALEPAMIHSDDPEQLLALTTMLRSYPDRDAARVVRTGEPELVPVAGAEALRRLAVDDDHMAMLQKTGLVGWLTVPLVARERTIGALTLLQTHSGRVLDARDVQVAGELARRAAQAIENTRLYLSARGASQARDDVLAAVAHDIRSPLSVIQFALEKVVRGLRLDAAAEAESAELIRMSVQRIKRLLTDLLDVSRIRAGTLWVERQPLDPASLVAEAVAAARPLADDIELVAEVAPSLPPVSADHDRLLQVFANLIGNALKFAPCGRQLHVGAQQRGAELVFHVRDHGDGVPADQLARLFDRFWQARRDDRRGAGLGLTIAKGIIEAHGGRIWVDSTEGLGSTFYFTLPL